MIVSKTLSVGGPLDHGVTTPTIDNIAQMWSTEPPRRGRQHQRYCRGMRAVSGVVRQTWCCRGRRAAASGFKREVTINMLLGGRVARRGGGGVVASATAAFGNNVHRASRSAAAAVFARIDVRCAAAMMAGVAMLSCWQLREQMLDDATRGGGEAGNAKRHRRYGGR